MADLQRSREQASDTSSQRTESSKAGSATATMDFDKQTRRERNRYHARVSRERRRNHERVLQESLAALEKENEEIAQANEALKRMVLGAIPTDIQHDINELARQNLALQLMMFRLIGPALEEHYGDNSRQLWSGSEPAQSPQFGYAGLAFPPGFPAPPDDGPGQQFTGGWAGAPHMPSPPSAKPSGR